MIPEYVVKFSAIDQVQKFIDDIRKIPCDVDACHGNYVVDAKSLLGILSLSLGREIYLRPHSGDPNILEQLQAFSNNYNSL